MALNFGVQVLNQSIIDLPPFKMQKNTKTINAEVLVATKSSSIHYYSKQQVKIFEHKILLGPNQGVIFLIKKHF